MTLYTITASGCDDSTTVHMELTADEAQTIARVAQAINTTSTSGCEPSLYMKPGEHEFINDVEVAK